MKRSKINGSQILHNQVIETIQNNTKGHRTKAELAERHSRKQLIEHLYKQEQTNNNGMVTTYDPKYAKQGYMLALLGATIQMIAMYFNTDTNTIDIWGRHFPAFRDALARGRMDFDMQVAERLGQRALGYDYEERETYQVLNKKTGQVQTLEKHYYKHMAPDVTAQQFWLQNRQRGLWTNTSRTEMFTKVDVDIRKKIDLSILDKVEVDSVREIAIAILSKQQGSIEDTKK